MITGGTASGSEAATALKVSVCPLRQVLHDTSSAIIAAGHEIRLLHTGLGDEPLNQNHSTTTVEINE